MTPMRLTLLDWIVAGLIAGCIALAVVGKVESMGRLRAEGAAALLTHRADSLDLANRKLRAHDDSVLAARTAERDSAVVRADREHVASQAATARAQRAGAAFSVAGDSVRAAAGDSARTVVALDTLLARHAEQVAALEARAGAAEHEASLLRIGLAAADSVAAAALRERDAADARGDAFRAALRAQEKTRPGTIQSIVTRAGWFLAGLGAGAAAEKLLP